MATADLEHEQVPPMPAQGAAQEREPLQSQRCSLFPRHDCIPSPPTLQFFCDVGTQRSGPFPRDQFFILNRFLTVPGPGDGLRRPTRRKTARCIFFASPGSEGSVQWGRVPRNHQELNQGALGFLGFDRFPTKTQQGVRQKTRDFQ